MFIVTVHSLMHLKLYFCTSCWAIQLAIRHYVSFFTTCMVNQFRDHLQRHGQFQPDCYANPHKKKLPFQCSAYFLLNFILSSESLLTLDMSFSFIVRELNFLFPSYSSQLGLGLCCPNDKFKDISESRPHKKREYNKKFK